MNYLFLLYNDENAWTALDDATRGEVFAAFGAYTEALAKAGMLRNGAPLEPSHATKRVRARKGAPAVEDGPFVDGKEQLGGFYLIEAKDLDEALDWAARCPTASYDGWVEVRPIWNVPQ